MPEPPLTRDAVIDLVRKAEIVDDDVLSSFMSRGPGLPPTASDTASKPCASANTGVRSLNCTPGSGKSGTSRVSDAINREMSVTAPTPSGPCSTPPPT